MRSNVVGWNYLTVPQLQRWHVEVWTWINNSIPLVLMGEITSDSGIRGLEFFRVSKVAPEIECNIWHDVNNYRLRRVNHLKDLQLWFAVCQIKVSHAVSLKLLELISRAHLGHWYMCEIMILLTFNYILKMVLYGFICNINKPRKSI